MNKIINFKKINEFNEQLKIFFLKFLKNIDIIQVKLGLLLKYNKISNQERMMR